MTRDLVTLKEDDDVVLGDDLLAEHDIRHLPVVKEGKLVGLVTHRDLIRALARHERNPGSPPVQVRDIMSRSLETLKPLSSAREAIHKLLDHKFGCVPVVEEGGRLVGIVTETDLIRLADRLLDKEERH
ncbi:CBS domain-containing protein [Archangium lansingense]|uniref:CBS domain-containing protein n=1 Tax=Archangium lansingense TaxID=2995310 RepID=A0ABT4AH39_9BACT|nr:CBS domain-containing protein [Archangium lansinium]MCY1081001.1 CBS domain-containing protein [Archangium lansinium]